MVSSSLGSPPSSPSPSIIQNVSDRRRAQRARLGVTVTLTVAGKLVDALGADVSPGGMRVVAAAPARVGDVASLVFFLNGDIVSACGTVQWCAPTKNGLATFGVRFTMVEEDGPVVVASYCRASVS
jgi:hypothetical protein